MKFLRALLLVVLGLVSLGLGISVFFLTMPQLAQDERAVSLAYRLDQWRPWITAGLLIVGLIVATAQWATSRRWFTRGFAVLAIAPLIFGAYLSNINATATFMFEKLDGAPYIPIADVDFMQDEQLIMSVDFEGEHLAYPVSAIAYHHIVNERLKVEPFVVTF